MWLSKAQRITNLIHTEHANPESLKKTFQTVATGYLMGIESRLRLQSRHDAHQDVSNSASEYHQGPSDVARTSPYVPVTQVAAPSGRAPVVHPYADTNAQFGGSSFKLHKPDDLEWQKIRHLARQDAIGHVNRIIQSHHEQGRIQSRD